MRRRPKQRKFLFALRVQRRRLHLAKAPRQEVEDQRHHEDDQRLQRANLPPHRKDPPLHKEGPPPHREGQLHQSLRELQNQPQQRKHHKARERELKGLPNQLVLLNQLELLSQVEELNLPDLLSRLLKQLSRPGPLNQQSPVQLRLVLLNQLVQLSLPVVLNQLVQLNRLVLLNLLEPLNHRELLNLQE